MINIPPQSQNRMPGRESELEPSAEHIRASYKGSGRLAGRCALITGGDSGIGRAVALHFAREGASVAITFLPEEADDGAEAIRACKAHHRTFRGRIGDEPLVTDEAVYRCGGDDRSTFAKVWQSSTAHPEHCVDIDAKMPFPICIADLAEFICGLLDAGIID